MISTPAMLTNCRRCGALILTGHSEGLFARADVTPLDRHQELDAILAGRTTYDLHPLGLPRRPYLFHRHQFRILSKQQDWKVVAQHKCPPGQHFPVIPGPPQELVIPYGKPIPANPPF